jgi:hypothetical protein
MKTPGGPTAAQRAAAIREGASLARAITQASKPDPNPLPVVRCPYLYKGGKRCTGHIVRIEAFKADICWAEKDGRWRCSVGEPRSHYHVYCSLKGNHAGCVGPDAHGMKFFLRDLRRTSKG